jgi:chorismate mutase
MVWGASWWHTARLTCIEESSDPGLHPRMARVSLSLMPRAAAQPRALRAIRGAVSVSHDEPAAIYQATNELLTAIVTRNTLVTDDIISVIFTVTPDLTSAFPALAARQMGWLDVPLLCTMEIPVPGSLGRCIRTLLLVETTRARESIQHVYLGAAEVLRPDLSPGPLAAAAEPRPAR